MRKQFTMKLDEKTLEKLKEIKDKTGVPMAQSLERSFLEKYGE